MPRARSTPRRSSPNRARRRPSPSASPARRRTTGSAVPGDAFAARNLRTGATSRSTGDGLARSVPSLAPRSQRNAAKKRGRERRAETLQRKAVAASGRRDRRWRRSARNARSLSFLRPGDSARNINSGLTASPPARGMATAIGTPCPRGRACRPPPPAAKRVGPTADFSPDEANFRQLDCRRTCAAQVGVGEVPHRRRDGPLTADFASAFIRLLWLAPSPRILQHAPATDRKNA